MKVEKPIFFIGTGRTGSTIVFEAFSVHERIAWWSTYDARFPRSSIVSIFPRFYDLPAARMIPRGQKRQYLQGIGISRRVLPYPDECWQKWEVLCGEKFRNAFVTADQANETEKQKLYRAIQRTIWLQGKDRFAAKLTGPPRIGYLRRLLSDALFVNIIRDVRPVIYSLLKTDFWQRAGAFHKPKWREGLSPGWQEEWEKYGRSPVALAAMQIRAIMQTLEEERGELKRNEYLEIYYKDFINRPNEIISTILDFCGLRPSIRVDEYIAEQTYEDMNPKYRSGFSTRDIEMIESILSAIPARLWDVSSSGGS